MKTLVDTLPEELKTELNAIRSALLKIDDGDEGTNVRSSFDPIGQGERILHRLENWLLDEEQKQMLRRNPRDVFYLHASAYLCDIALSGDGGVSSVEAPGNGSPVELRSVIRSVYACSRRLILNRWRDLGIGDVGRAGIIARICLGTDIEAAEDQEEDIENRHSINDASVNFNLLSAAVRLSKALELTAPITTLEIQSFLPSADRDFAGAIDPFFSVESAGPHPFFSGTIQVKIRCRHPGIHRALKHHEGAVQQLLQRINRHASPCFLFSDVIFEIEPEGYEPVDLKFTVDSSAALQLFAGNRLYSDNRVFLRELIQNAVDACNLRRLHDDTYEPSISIAFNEDISIISIRDNGIGMDRQWIEKYFLKIGISLYRSGDVKGINTPSPPSFSFISQFGIGFLSSFLVAEKIVIKTRKAASAGLMIEIRNLRDYFDIRRLRSDFPVGTEVQLHLRKSKINYCRSLEYVGYLKTNIRFVSVPVRLQVGSREIIAIGEEKLIYDVGKTADTDFVAPLRFSSSEGYVFLRAKKHTDHIYALDSTKGGISVFQDGIFVTQIDSLLPEGARQHVIGRINLLGDEKCALSMDRNRIFWTDDQLLNIKKTILHGLVEIANRVMAAVQAQNAPENTQRSLINHLSIFFEFNEVDDAMHRRLCESIRRVVEKRFRDFVRVHFPHTRRVGGIPEADGYSEAWQQRIVKSFARK